MHRLFSSRSGKVSLTGGGRQLRSIALGLLIAAMGAAAAALAEPALSSQVIKVIDGDTIALGDQRIRLWGIDAPEIRQQCVRDGATYPCGRAAKAILEALVGSGQVACGLRWPKTAIAALWPAVGLLAETSAKRSSGQVGRSIIRGTAGASTRARSSMRGIFRWAFGPGPLPLLGIGAPLRSIETEGGWNGSDS